MKPSLRWFAAVALLWAWPVLAGDSADAPEAEGEAPGTVEGEPPPEGAPDGGTMSSAAPAPAPATEGPSPAELLAKLKEALAKPEIAAAVVREVGPKAGSCEAIQLLLRAAGEHGKNHPDLLEACKEAIRGMDLKAALPCLASMKKMGLSSAAETLAYQILGEFKIEDGPRPSPNEKSLYEQRRDILLTGLSTSYNPILVAAAESLVKTGDKKAVAALVDRLPKVGGSAQKSIGSALETLTGLAAKTPGEWSKWYKSEGVAAFPAAGGAGSKGDAAAAAAEEAWEKGYYFEYHGIPVKTTKMSFVIDVSESMAPEHNPSEKEFPRPPKTGDDPALKKENWVEEEKTFASKLHMAKYELIATILQMPPNCKFNLVFFGGKRQVFCWPPNGGLMKADADNKNQAITRVLNQRTFLGTPLTEGLEAGWHHPDVDTIFLLSDGRPVHSRINDPGQVLALAKQVCTGKRKIVINGIDLGAIKGAKDSAGSRTPLIQDLASATGGECKAIQSLTVRTKVFRPAAAPAGEKK